MLVLTRFLKYHACEKLDFKLPVVRSEHVAETLLVVRERKAINLDSSSRTIECRATPSGTGSHVRSSKYCPHYNLNLQPDGRCSVLLACTT